MCKVAATETLLFFLWRLGVEITTFWLCLAFWCVICRFIKSSGISSAFVVQCYCFDFLPFWFSKPVESASEVFLSGANSCCLDRIRLHAVSHVEWTVTLFLRDPVSIMWNHTCAWGLGIRAWRWFLWRPCMISCLLGHSLVCSCLLYTSDAADE